MVAALVWEEEVGDASKFYLYLSLVSRQEKNRHRKEAFFSGKHNETVNNEFQQQRLAPPNQLSFGPLVTFLLNR